MKFISRYASEFFLRYLGFWQQVLCEVNDAQNYLQTEESVGDAKVYGKSLKFLLNPQDESGGSIYFGDGSKDVQLSYEDDLRRTMLSSIDKSNCRNSKKIPTVVESSAKMFFKAWSDIEHSRT
ncbi:hypothetical protein TNCV_1391871 [Trichonephila clavipes]|nr:hypothetical protein TNCV_1391871 [Trichonephila clavipes]